MERERSDDALAIMFEGGGARAAYQVGALRALAARVPDAHVPILTGVSAGAINAVHLANYPGSFGEAVETLAVLWDEIETRRVFRTDARSLGGLLVRWVMRFGLGGARRAPKPQGLVDTAPLRSFLTRAFACPDGRLDGIARNIERGRLDAVAITTTDFGSGRTTSWVQGRAVEAWYRPTRLGIPAELTLDHVMASTAVPLFFPAVKLGPSWHGDGGIRQIAPLSPALKLGAKRIIAVSTRHALDLDVIERPKADVYPPPAQILGVMLNAAFLDLLDYDAHVLTRVTELVEKLPEDQREGLRPAHLLMLRPSRDLGEMAREYEERLPRAFRFLARGLGTREMDMEGLDLLSMLLFDPEYIDALMDLGRADAEAQADEIEAFVTGG